MSVKGLTSYPFQSFGQGLNLRDKPDTVSPEECIDCRDVFFTDRGAIVQRKGYKALTGALTNRVASLEPFYQTGGTRQLLAGCGTRLEGLSAAGAVVDSETGLTSAVWDFARFGKPNAEVAYAGNGTDTLRKWNGAEWTAPTATVDGVGGKAMPKAGALCAWPGGANRLVATRFSTSTGGPNGATSSPDHVYFSDPGDPESWSTAPGKENYVQLAPGNGEAIQAVVAFREFIIVFKETSFYVFYSVTEGPEGSADFNFKPVEAGVGMVSPRAVCVQPSGVYFMSRHGVYRTTGAEPEEVSQIVEPIWSGEASPFFTQGVLSQAEVTSCTMTSHEDRIYLSYPVSSTKYRTLVYDPQLDWWSLYSIPASCLASFRVESKQELVFGYAVGEKMVGRHSTSYTNDDGVAIESSWRQGWLDLDNPDVKTIRSSKVWGTGIAGMSLDTDFLILAEDPVELDMDGSTGSSFGGEGTFGGEGIFGDVTHDLLPAYNGRDARGTVFSMAFSNSTLDQEWSIHRADLQLREIRIPSTLDA